MDEMDDWVDESGVEGGVGFVVGEMVGCEG